MKWVKSAVQNHIRRGALQDEKHTADVSPALFWCLVVENSRDAPLGGVCHWLSLSRSFGFALSPLSRSNGPPTIMRQMLATVRRRDHSPWCNRKQHKTVTTWNGEARAKAVASGHNEA